MTNGIHIILYNLPGNDGSVQGVETVMNSGFRGEMKDNHLVGTIDKRSIICNESLMNMPRMTKHEITQSAFDRFLQLEQSMKK